MSFTSMLLTFFTLSDLPRNLDINIILKCVLNNTNSDRTSGLQKPVQFNKWGKSLVSAEIGERTGIRIRFGGITYFVNGLFKKKFDTYEQ